MLHLGRLQLLCALLFAILEVGGFEWPAWDQPLAEHEHVQHPYRKLLQEHRDHEGYSQWDPEPLEATETSKRRRGLAQFVTTAPEGEAITPAPAPGPAPGPVSPFIPPSNNSNLACCCRCGYFTNHYYSQIYRVLSKIAFSVPRNHLVYSSSYLFPFFLLQLLLKYTRYHTKVHPPVDVVAAPAAPAVTMEG